MDEPVEQYDSLQPPEPPPPPRRGGAGPAAFWFAALLAAAGTVIGITARRWGVAALAGVLFVAMVALARVAAHPPQGPRSRL